MYVVTLTMWYNDLNPKSGSSEYVGVLRQCSLLCLYIKCISTECTLLTCTCRICWVEQSLLH